MKIVEFCRPHKASCPVLKIDADRVEIGEVGNLCVLTVEQWENLKQKVLDGEA